MATLSHQELLKIIGKLTSKVKEIYSTIMGNAEPQLDQVRVLSAELLLLQHKLNKIANDALVGSLQIIDDLPEGSQTTLLVNSYASELSKLYLEGKLPLQGYLIFVYILGKLALLIDTQASQVDRVTLANKLIDNPLIQRETPRLGAALKTLQQSIVGSQSSEEAETAAAADLLDRLISSNTTYATTSPTGDVSPVEIIPHPLQSSRTGNSSAAASARRSRRLAAAANTDSASGPLEAAPETAHTPVVTAVTPVVVPQTSTPLAELITVANAELKASNANATPDEAPAASTSTASASTQTATSLKRSRVEPARDVDAITTEADSSKKARQSLSSASNAGHSAAAFEVDSIDGQRVHAAPLVETNGHADAANIETTGATLEPLDPERAHRVALTRIEQERQKHLEALVTRAPVRQPGFFFAAPGGDASAHAQENQTVAHFNA